MTANELETIGSEASLKQQPSITGDMNPHKYVDIKCTAHDAFPE